MPFRFCVRDSELEELGEETLVKVTGKMEFRYKEVRTRH